MLKRVGKSLKGMRVSVSGSGNVAQYAVEKAMPLGAKVVTVSDSGGTVVDEAGFTPEKLAKLMEIKNIKYGRCSEYAAEVGAQFIPNARPWNVPVDVALPCATQNELDENDAKTLIKNGVVCVAEGANMPSTIEAAKLFEDARILYAPGKASNAGGVATSGLEMSQNAIRLSWTREEVDRHLNEIMKNIHNACVKYGTRADGSVSYISGANIAGFVKVADAMLAQGVILKEIHLNKGTRGKKDTGSFFCLSPVADHQFLPPSLRSLSARAVTMFIRSTLSCSDNGPNNS